MDKPSELLGKRIKELRLARGLTHEDLALSLGLSQGAISQWESGATSPRGKNRKALADLLVVSEASLFSDVAPEFQPAREPSAEEILEIFIQGSKIPDEKKELLIAVVRADLEDLSPVFDAAGLKIPTSSKQQKLSR
jgi:transcriptional regulator with XRE-family HTH domain